MTQEPEDVWAWARPEPHVDPPTVDPSDVVAVLVAHNGSAWLPRTLVALARMDTQPGALIAVNAGSTDDSAHLLNQARDQGLITDVVAGDPEQGFGANVAIGLAACEQRHEWVWLLHDDSAPKADALTQLLIAACEETDGLAPSILVPKLLRPKRRNHPDQMGAVGESISRSGMKVPTVEPGDIDQKQDEPSRVLGASTAGMLIQRSVWDELGGTHPLVPLFRDGVELGWRANARGMLVRTCPNAALRHEDAGFHGLRDSALAPRPRHSDAVAGMTVAALHASDPAKAIRHAAATSRWRALAALAGKSPVLARGYLSAAKQFTAQRDEIIAAAASIEGDADVSALLPARGWALRAAADSIAGRISDRYYDLVDAGDESGGMLDELTGDDFAGTDQKSRLFAPAIVGLFVMTVLCVIAHRHLLHPGFLSGPALLPAPESLEQAWSAFVQSAQLGSNAPWLGLAAVGTTLFFGHGDAFMSVIVCGGPAWAGLTAYRFMQPITGRGYWTTVIASAWGLGLPVLGITGQGRADLTVLAVALPLIALYARRWITHDVGGIRAWRRTAILALLVAVVTASLPAMFLIGVVIGAWMLARHRDPKLCAFVALVPLAVWAPWCVRLVGEPGRFLTGADPALGAGQGPLSVLQVLTSSWSGSPVWLGAGFLAICWGVGIAGAVRQGSMPRAFRRVMVGLGMAALVAAVFLGKVIVPVAGVGVRADVQSWLLVSVFAALTLASYGIGRHPRPGADDSPEDVECHRRQSRWRNVLGCVLLVAVAASSVWWAVVGTQGLRRQEPPLPTYVVGLQHSPAASRTLMLDFGEGARYSLVAAGLPAWGSAERPLPHADPQVSDEILQVVQQFAQAQPTDDLAARLSALGIAHVWVRGTGDDAVAALTAATGLEATQAGTATYVFTLTPQPSRYAVVSGQEVSYVSDGTITASGERLVVAEAGTGWHASVGGEKLTPVAADWSQTFELAGRTGELKVWHSPDWLSMAWYAVVLGALILLALPVASRSYEPKRNAVDA